MRKMITHNHFFTAFKLTRDDSERRRVDSTETDRLLPQQQNIHVRIFVHLI